MLQELHFVQVKRGRAVLPGVECLSYPYIVPILSSYFLDSPEMLAVFSKMTFQALLPAQVEANPGERASTLTHPGVDVD
jgi:hypothetical protein